MTSPAVVILTEPERCQLAGADILRQAVIQIQQLSKAGLPTSQTFCDHPPSAMKFIEAYVEAYPELQLGTADLPLPEQLYSVVAEGRILPLSASIPPPVAKPGEASQLYPLYVLSLGAPDALMRALKQSSLASGDIKIIEIAPVAHPSPDPSGATDALAHEGRFWQAEASADRRHHEDDGLASTEGAPSDPLKLDSVEANLDQVHIDQHQQDHHHDRAWDEPVPNVGAPHVAVTAAAPAAAVAAGTGTTGPSGGANNGGGMVAEPPVVATVVSGSANESDVLRPLPAAVSSTVGESPDAKPAALGADLGSAAHPGAAGDTKGYEDDGGRGDPAETDVPADGDGNQGAAGTAIEKGNPSAQLDSDSGQEAALPAASDSGSSTRSDQASRTEVSSFREPDGDVTYRPNASFGTNDDVSYPLPAGAGLDGLLRDVFGRSGYGETVDLAALVSTLADPPGTSSASLEDLPFRFGGMREAIPRSADQGGAPNSAPNDASTTTDHHGSDHDDAGHERTPVTHDLDI